MSKVVAAAKRLLCDQGPPPRAAGSWWCSWYPTSAGDLPEQCPERPNPNSRQYLAVMGDWVSCRGVPLPVEMSPWVGERR